MIIKGRPRGGGSQLAAYLLNREGAEHAEILEMRGLDCFNGDLRNALIGMEIDGKVGTCEKPLYHASFRLENGAELTPEQWIEAADRLEKKLGLEEHERALILHEENGEKHLHVVWNRIDQETLRAARLEFDAYKRLEIARELERDFGTRQLSDERSQEPLSRAEYEQAKRQDRDPNELRDVKETIRECWTRSDNGQSFETALDQENLVLARGDTPRAPVVIVDEQGQIYGIPRTVGEKSKAVANRLADLDPEALPSIAQAKEYQAEQQRQHEQARADRAREEAAKAEREAAEKEAHQAQEKPTQAQEAKTPDKAIDFFKNLSEKTPRLLTPDEFEKYLKEKPERERQAAQAAKQAKAEHARAEFKAGHIKEIQEAWEKSKDGKEFEASLEKSGFKLAKTEKDEKLKWFQAVHKSGFSYGITPEILDGKSYSEIRAKLAPFIKDPSLMKTAEQERAAAKEIRTAEKEAREAARAVEFAAKVKAQAEQRTKEADEKATPEQAQARAVIKEAWEKSKDGKEFEAALEQDGFSLAKTGKEFMPIVALDGQGRVFSIGLTVGETSKATREAISDLDPAKLPTIEESQRHLHQIKLAEGLRSQDPAEQQRAAAKMADQGRLQMRGEIETKTDFKDAAREFKALKKENLEINHAINQRRTIERFEENAKNTQEPPQGKTNAEAKTQAPEPEKIATRAGKALVGGGLELLGGLGEKIIGPVTYEGIKQVAAQDQKHAYKGLDAAAQDYNRALTPDQKAQKAQELERAAAEARKASDSYREAIRNAKPGEARRAAMRAEYRADFAAKQAEQEAARLRETDQQRQKREAREREEERRRRERERERER